MTSFEETELRLGLPGGGAGGGGKKMSDGGDVAVNGNGKRGYDDTNMDLKLKLSSNEGHKNLPGGGCSVNPPAKTQVVGWPPVRSYRKNMVAVQKGRREKEADGGATAAPFVKVSMDGAPYLRKVDLKMYDNYQDLFYALANMFTSFTFGKGGCEGMKEQKVMDVVKNSDYVPTYEDKDGDWMLVGDVPWEYISMFVDSCKRLRITKGKEAIGLAPRAMEKCKNRS